MWNFLVLENNRILGRIQIYPKECRRKIWLSSEMLDYTTGRRYDANFDGKRRNCWGHDMGMQRILVADIFLVLEEILYRKYSVSMCTIHFLKINALKV